MSVLAISQSLRLLSFGVSPVTTFAQRHLQKMLSRSPELQTAPQVRCKLPLSYLNKIHHAFILQHCSCAAVNGHEHAWYTSRFRRSATVSCVATYFCHKASMCSSNPILSISPSTHNNTHFENTPHYDMVEACGSSASP